MRKITAVRRLDLHMHSNVSDGTDTPENIIEVVRNAGLELFALTDHDAIEGCGKIRSLLTEEDPLFISGIEFSCRDEEGKYHILGYGYDAESEAMRQIVQKGHEMRLEKIGLRLDLIREKFGISFSEEDLSWLYSNESPGKPHLANLMIRQGIVDSIGEAFRKYLNQAKIPSVYVRPEEAITAIIGSGGIPVLAHPAYGSGDELILGDEMDARLRRLMNFGLQGMEAYYSGFSDKIHAEMMAFAEKYGLYITAGSDYHGKNKMVPIGDTNLDASPDSIPGLRRFLENVPLR